MPIIEVKMFDRRVDDESAAKVIQNLTDGLCAAVGEEVREETWVIVEGVSPKRWGFGGSVRG
jgi:4-oxalocrotonate tautomerase